VPKEYFEIFCNGQTVIIHDFKIMEIYGKSVSKMKLRTQDKGHKEELVRFFHSIKNGTPSPIPYEEIYNTTLTTFEILESIKQGQALSAY
jgi:polar amino acid transport system substrate-binding protein